MYDRFKPRLKWLIGVAHKYRNTFKVLYVVRVKHNTPLATLEW